MAEESEIDRLSALPDDILSRNIVSELSLIDAVRTSVLSCRWRSLWKQIPHLDLSEEFFKSVLGVEDGVEPIEPRVGVETLEEVRAFLNDIIYSILLHHCGRIERFSIHVTNYFLISALERLPIEQWIHHAALKEVKHLSLKMPYSSLDLPPSLFECHLLRDLEIDGLLITQIPTEFDGLRFLQSCSLSRVLGLRDDELKQIIELCPLLHELVVVCCLELMNLKVQAPNLNSLKIGDCNCLDSLIADCPQLVELQIENCKRLIEFRMNSCVLFRDLHDSDVQIPKALPMLDSLRKLSMKAWPAVSDLALLTLIGCFRNLEEVQVSTNIRMFEENHSEQERAKGEAVADSTFPRLKKASVEVSSAIKKMEAIMLALILNNAPSLNTITVTLPYCPANIHDKEFINEVLNLQQIHKTVDIRMEINEERLDATCSKAHEEDYYDM